MKKTLVIVGNGPLPRDLSREIDAADYVLRFNNPPKSSEVSGSKTDLLMLATSTKQTQQWLMDPIFLDSAFLRNTEEILFPVHPSIIRRFHHRPNFLSRLKGRRADWTKDAFEILSVTGKAIRVMKPDHYFEACAELGIPEEKMKQLFPSTGFLGIWYVLRNFAQTEWQVQICGFSWEGWKRHDWSAERHWVEGKISLCRIEMLS
jgi:hypothetical protein